MYFADSKCWVQVEIMEKVLETLNRQMMEEERNVILFLNSATGHPTPLVDIFSNIKIVFLPKNTTSQLQPLDAGIIIIIIIIMIIIIIIIIIFNTLFEIVKIYIALQKKLQPNFLYHFKK